MHTELPQEGVTTALSSPPHDGSHIDAELGRAAPASAVFARYCEGYWFTLI